MFGEEGYLLREAGEEYGAATGRPRRVGAFDIVATRYGAKMQAPHDIVLTKLDVLDSMDEIPVCVQYEVDGERIDKFVTGAKLNRAKPVIIRMKGWKKPLGGCRKESDLPKEARAYVDWIEEHVGVPIDSVSVGAHRDAYLLRN
jgi:adenylosuccinate synthase